MLSPSSRSRFRSLNIIDRGPPRMHASGNIGVLVEGPILCRDVRRIPDRQSEVMGTIVEMVIRPEVKPVLVIGACLHVRDIRAGYLREPGRIPVFIIIHRFFDDLRMNGRGVFRLRRRICA